MIMISVLNLNNVIKNTYNKLRHIKIIPEFYVMYGGYLLVNKMNE
jgi:hypothetical protein